MAVTLEVLGVVRRNVKVAAKAKLGQLPDHTSKLLRMFLLLDVSEPRDVVPGRRCTCKIVASYRLVHDHTVEADPQGSDGVDGQIE